MTVRPKVVGLLTDYDTKRSPGYGPFVHHDGRVYTAKENELILDANHEEMLAAAEQLADTPAGIANLMARYVRMKAQAMKNIQSARGEL
jgi:hypothetical protein